MKSTCWCKGQKFFILPNGKTSHVFTKASGSVITFLVMFVDDILLIGYNIPTWKCIMSWFLKYISIRNLEDNIYSWNKYLYRYIKMTNSIRSKCIYWYELEKFLMKDSNIDLLSITHGMILISSQSSSTKVGLESMNRISFASAIESIVYVVLCTKPDTSYAWSMMNRYQ